MWEWEQGRLEYFQFDILRKIARSGSLEDLRQISRLDLARMVGLPFLPDDPKYKPWRNYGRLFQIAMIAVPIGQSRSELTIIGEFLSRDGEVTTDEYLHFLARATTDPTPALSKWDHRAKLRYPLLFALRFILTRAATGRMTTTFPRVLHAYNTSRFVGNENEADFLRIINLGNRHPTYNRQAFESIRVLAQLSYLTAIGNEINVSLATNDARQLFDTLEPTQGTPLEDRAEEILRRAELFPSLTAEHSSDNQADDIGNLEESGFVIMEGRRVRRTHLMIERNQMIRKIFFQKYPDQICDLCGIDTCKHYPWTSKLLEVHHLLPLCSGARTANAGTSLDDLVANCPTCHRAVHRYYDRWLSERLRVDFIDAHESRNAYEEAKLRHQSTIADDYY